MPSEGPFTLVVLKTEEGERLDKLLASRLIAASRSTLRRWIDEGQVLVDGQPARASSRMREGMRVHVTPMDPPTTDAIAQDIPLTVLFEDEYLLVIDKPAGLVVHPAPGHPDGTLVNAVLHHTRIDRDVDEKAQRPGIVHRLDRDTSGIMVVAKSLRAKEGLVKLFQAHDIERMYLALAVGALPDAITFDTMHGRHPTDRKRFSTKVVSGKKAVTHIRVRERIGAVTFIECRLETGRTHQIRAHLSDHGTPILGDTSYGKAPRDPKLRDIASQLGRQALHAAVLGFVHPITAAKLRFETEPPPDFQRALAELRALI
ncbi:MAG: RluA family pseudouridine synthase [Sandaracinaceae bacterium]|nr:RluA family pseudouridine synthase [Sandaracinaceae bacterium]